MRVNIVFPIVMLLLQSGLLDTKPNKFSKLEIISYINIIWFLGLANMVSFSSQLLQQVYFSKASVTIKRMQHHRYYKVVC